MKLHLWVEFFERVANPLVNREHQYGIKVGQSVVEHSVALSERGVVEEVDVVGVFFFKFFQRHQGGRFGAIYLDEAVSVACHH